MKEWLPKWDKTGRFDRFACRVPGGEWSFIQGYNPEDAAQFFAEDQNAEEGASLEVHVVDSSGEIRAFMATPEVEIRYEIEEIEISA